MLLAACLTAGMAGLARAGSVQFSTYYPAPFGIYDRLRLPPRAALAEPCDAGTFYYETGAGLRFCDEATQTWGGLGGGVWTQSGNNIYPADTASNPNLMVGIGTTTPEFKLTVDNDGGILAKGTFNSGATLATSGPGVRLIWYPRKAAFRAGLAQSTEWNDANIGDGSVAMGDGTSASGLDSTAMGRLTTASGIGSTAMGVLTTANGTYTTAMGQNTTASDLYSTAMGSRTTASGLTSTAMGQNTTASGRYSTAMGLGTTSQAVSSTVLGQYNIISGDPITWINTDPLFVIGNGTDASNRSNAMTVLKNGNVGIGTTGPSAKLEILTTAAADPVFKMGSAGVSDYQSLMLYNGSGNTSLFVAGAANNFIPGTTAGDGGYRVAVGKNMFFGNTSAAFMTLLSSGKVGIGTTNPLGGIGLHLKTSQWSYSTAAGMIIQAATAGDSPGLFLFDSNNTERGVLGVASLVHNYSNDAQIGDVVLRATNGRLIFTTENIIGPPYPPPPVAPARMLIDQSGNVGIGTAMPGYKLDVSGTIRATGGTPIYQCPVGDPDWQRNQCVGQLSTNSTCLLVVGGGAESTASCTLVGRLVAP
ncbi:MAG: hypothetical protein HY210_00195 [Candidatus Omnitrophica bacterium]|nr:hypothetical protein [Candidatus Omnitrophota bacterium]